MSVATTQPAQSACHRIPVLVPLYGDHLESFCAQSDGTYWCGSGAASVFRLAFSGVAANHCSFIRNAGTFSVNRIDGRVWVNDLPVNGIIRLTEGDVISLGPVTYRLEIQNSPLNLPESEDQPLRSFKSAETVVEPLSPDLISASLPITAGSAAPSGQNTSNPPTLQNELEEHQRLLTLRQQQLGELTQVVRERERDADSRLIAIDEQSTQLTAQWNELARQQERLALQERENALRSQETDRQCYALADQQLQLANAAEQNSRLLAAVEQAQQEHSRQEEELQLLQRSIETRHLALQEWQSELDSRANEVAARLLALKSLSRRQGAVQIVVAEPATSQAAIDALNLKEDVMEAKRKELDHREAEIVAAEACFFEKRRSTEAIIQAAESERSDLLSANKDLLCERYALSQLRQDLACRESAIAEREDLAARQLDDMLGQFALLNLRAVKLKDRESEIDSRAAEMHCRVQQFKNVRHSHREVNRTEPPDNESYSTLIERTAELSAVRLQLDEMQRALTVSDGERASMLAKYTLLANAVPPVSQVSADSALMQSCQTQSWELDQRAELLDRRDEELRERTRRIELTESDIESQRRLLLEARQQLEQARAEIQVAMRKHTEPEQPAASPLPEQLFGLPFVVEPKSDRQNIHPANRANVPVHCESEDPAYVPATDLRSELAGLFGLRKPAAESMVASAAFVDVSEPSGENQSIMFHFDSDAALLAATESNLTVVDDAEPAREENSDDVVRDYMELLLSRSRRSAGHALPCELKSVEKKREPPAATSTSRGVAGPSPKSPPKVKSYIEQYFAGKLANLDNSLPTTMSAPDMEVTSVPVFHDPRPIQPLQPRPKIDRLKLKENMDSFRTLSTLSVENALASHAIKVEQLGFSGRTVFTALLIISTVLLGIVNACGAIDSPMLVWVTFTSSIAMLTELRRQYLAIAVRTRKPFEPLSATAQAKWPVQQSDKLPAFDSAVPKSATNDFSRNNESTKPSDALVYPESRLAATSAS